MSDREPWEQTFMLHKLNDALAGGLIEAAELLEKDHTTKLFSFFRETLAGRAGEYHERHNGLLTPEAIADQPMREMRGREAEMADAQLARLELKGSNPQRNELPGAAPGCRRGLHAWGPVEGDGAATCRGCGVRIAANLIPR